MHRHLLEIREVEYLEGYRMRLRFNDGVVKDVDLSDELWGPMFEPLEDCGLFSQVRVDSELGTIAWPNGADISPDTLYAMGETVRTKPA